MGGLKINGKGAVNTVKPSPVKQQAPINVPMDWDDPWADPFATPDVTDPSLAASFVADCGIYAQQMVSDMAKLARRLEKLTLKLQDPKLADSPHRPDAIEKARTMDAELIELVRDAAWHEAHTDRTWQVLTTAQRRHADAAAHWMTDPAASRLIGRTWKGIGQMETWPRGFRVRRAWLQGFPFLLIIDMRDAGVWRWKATPDPPDPFAGDVIFDTRLAHELENHT